MAKISNKIIFLTRIQRNFIDSANFKIKQITRKAINSLFMLDSTIGRIRKDSKYFTANRR